MQAKAMTVVARGEAVREHSREIVGRCRPLSAPILTRPDLFL
jgi:hypothetical protein